METPMLRPKPDRRKRPRTVLGDGDVVVRVDKRDEMFLYVVTTVSGAEEFQSFTAEQAVAQALACAKGQRTRAWFTGGNECVLLEDFREVKRFRIDVT
jgi:hypothetical protein